MSDPAEFRIRFVRVPGRKTYLLHATAPGGADVSGTFRLPMSPAELEIFVLKIARTRTGARSLSTPKWRRAKEFGGSRYKALMGTPTSCSSTTDPRYAAEPSSLPPA
jgi:hypothetical protein